MQEIIAVMREAGTDRHGARVRALIVVLWRGGLRIQEALSISERDLDGSGQPGATERRVDRDYGGEGE